VIVWTLQLQGARRRTIAQSEESGQLTKALHYRCYRTWEDMLLLSASYSVIKKSQPRLLLQLLLLLTMVMSDLLKLHVSCYFERSR